jgi:hypothetical protein
LRPAGPAGFLEQITVLIPQLLWLLRKKLPMLAPFPKFTASRTFNKCWLHAAAFCPSRDSQFHCKIGQEDFPHAYFVLLRLGKISFPAYKQRKSIKNSKAPLRVIEREKFQPRKFSPRRLGRYQFFELPPTAPVNRWLGGDGRHNEEAFSDQGRVIIDKRP